MHLVGIGGGYCGIVLGKQESNAVKLRLVPIVMGVWLHNHLLAFCPRHKLERPRAYGGVGIAFLVCVFGNNTQRRQNMGESFYRIELHFTEYFDPFYDVLQCFSS